MSNLSDIGFNCNTEEEFDALLEKAYENSTQISTTKGSYFHFSDTSGAELWTQINKKMEMIGGNPHFKGKSRRKVAITSSIERKESVLDGAFHAWADPLENDNSIPAPMPFF